MENCFPFRDEHLLFHYILASFIFYSKISIPYHALLIAHFRNQFSRVFALLSSMPRFKSINFYQNRSKLSYFAKKKKSKISQHSGLDLCTSGDWGHFPQTPSLRWLRPQTLTFCGWRLYPHTFEIAPYCRFLATRQATLTTSIQKSISE